MWTPRALPSVVALTAAAANLTDPKYRARLPSLNALTAQGADAQAFHHRGAIFRICIDASGADPPAVILPLDRLFEVRAVAAMRLWRVLYDSNPGPNPARLTKYRRNRLVLALRALDATLDGLTYREIVEIITRARILAREWKSHDVRGTIIRLANLGMEMMQGGYFDLLVHPYWREPRRVSSAKS